MIYCGILCYTVIYCLLPLQAAHRKQTLLITAFYKTWPRMTFLYTYLFCYYDIFLPVLQFHFPLAEDGGEPDKQEIRTDETEARNDAGASTEVGMDRLPPITYLVLSKHPVSGVIVEHCVIAVSL